MVCEQCLTEMLSVYSEERNGQGVYIGIARQQYFDDYGAGDVMVGVCNGPDMVFRLDLFTAHQWETNTYDGDDFHEHRENGWLWDTCTQYNPWFEIPSKTLRLSRHFGRPPENHFFVSWIMVSVARIFEQRGIPLDKQERLKWARQFGSHVNHLWHRGASYYGRPELGARYHTYDWHYYRPTGEVNERGWPESEMVEGIWFSDEPVPDKLKPKSDEEFEAPEMLSEDDQGPPYKYETP